MYRPSALLASIVLMLGAATVPNAPAAEAPAPAAAAAFAPMEGAVPANQVKEDMLGQEIAVVGQVQSVMPSTGERVPTRLILSEASGKPFMLVYWQDTALAVEGGKGVPKEGTAVSARGKVEAYRDTLQIRIRSAEQIRLAGVTPGAGASAPATKMAAATAPATVSAKPGADGYYTAEQIPALKKTHLNKDILIRGTVTRFTAARSERAPHVIMLGQEPNAVEVVYWSEQQVEFAKQPGATIYASGQLQEYRERTQIRLADLDHLSASPLAPEFLPKERPVATPASGPATSWAGSKAEKSPEIRPITVPAGTMLRLNEISSAHAGNSIRVAGKVFSVAPGEAGTRTAILSGNGAMLAVLLGSDAGEVAVGDQVEVAGDLQYDALRAQPRLVATKLTKAPAAPKP